MSRWQDNDDRADDDAPDYSGLTDWSRAEGDARLGMELADCSHGPRTRPDLLRAVALLRAAIELVPTDAAWHVALASALEALGETPAAVDVYRAAFDLDTADLHTGLALAHTLHRSSRHREALAVLAQLHDTDPTFEPAYCLKIAVLTELQRFPLAEETYYLARLHEDDCPRCDLAMARALLAQNQPHRARSLLSRLAETAPSDDAELLLAQACLACGDFDLAANHFLSRLHDEPDNPHLWIHLGTAQQLASRHHDAAASFKRAVELDPDLAPAHAALARFLLCRNQAAPALAAASDALRADPTLAGLHLLIARAALDARIPAVARHHLRRELQVLSDADPAALLELALLLDRARRPTLALRVLRRLVDAAPQSVGAWQNLAVLCFRLRRFDDGLAASYTALRLHPHHPDVLHNLALAHARRSDLPAATGYARLATAAAPPTDPEPRRLLTRLRLAGLKSRLSQLIQKPSLPTSDIPSISPPPA